MNTVKELRRVDRVRARLLKLAFEALYSHFAWAYDWVSRTFFLGQWRIWQRATMRFLEGKRVLEVGMGTGDLQIDLLRAGYEAWGIDRSPQMMRQAVRKARRLGVESFRVCRAGADALPFPAGFFDSVVSTFPSDYIARRETLDEIARVLRPGGKLVVVPGGRLKARDTRGKAFEGVARVVYGYDSGEGERGLAVLDRGALEHAGWFRWLGVLRDRMAEAGFRMTAYIGSNERGSVLVIVAAHEPRDSLPGRSLRREALLA